jgi:hypothetical protein
MVNVTEAQKIVNCFFINTQRCQKESNGYFVTANNCIKNLSSLGYFNDHKIRSLITTVNPQKNFIKGTQQ